MIDPVSSAASAAAVQRPNGGLGKDAFLKLLVAQLKYQDPMKPADSTQFLSQTAQFNSLERLEDLLGAQRTMAASALVGRQVVARSADGSPVTGVVTSVRLGDDPVLKVDGHDVPLSTVSEVTQPQL